MNKFTRVVSWLFGILLIGLSLFVTAETASRKLFNISFQGADELGGYVLAIGGALSFTVALLERGHIRIDLLYDRMSPLLQAVFNWLAAVVLAVLGVFLARYCWLVIRDTIDYGSTAPTAWATPLIYPQTLWYLCLLTFTLASLLLAFKASRQLFTGKIAQLNATFHPKGAIEELNEELSDLKKR
tara:strand:- start:948 stop:1502 length:555 start_codon:yes stop_codon:yes gene_type:complete